MQIHFLQFCRSGNFPVFSSLARAIFSKDKYWAQPRSQALTLSTYTLHPQTVPISTFVETKRFNLYHKLVVTTGIFMFSLRKILKATHPIYDVC